MKKLSIVLSVVVIGTSLLLRDGSELSPYAHAIAMEQATRHDELQPASTELHGDPVSASPTAPLASRMNSPAASNLGALGAQPDELQTVDKPLQEAIRTFKDTLAKEPGFEAWASASWTSQPLGPGTHGWIVLIQQSGRELGYMVIHAVESGSYQLTEYGRGEYPLFSSNTLYQSLVRLELIDYNYKAEPFYWDPLQAAWRVTVEQADRVWYIDAKTGEELPLTNLSAEPRTTFMPTHAMKTVTNPSSLHTIILRRDAHPSEPYAELPWVQGTPAAFPSFAKLMEQVEGGQPPVLVTQLYNGTANVPLLVAGVHEWSDGSRYVHIVQDDARYIPYESLTVAGQYYP
ncbi:hypothetical protein [Paenibacillus sp. YYML68]|uniref:hypothetical protein n=1 Tax=Paenibacillus sp. YYML68 TaxID=2909250 RepID=UPI00248F6025|nr:hypothetical protein [Paenibacillus sp. YYML68]